MVRSYLVILSVKRPFESLIGNILYFDFNSLVFAIDLLGDRTPDEYVGAIIFYEASDDEPIEGPLQATA